MSLVYSSKHVQRDFTALVLYVFRVKEQLLIHGHWKVRIFTQATVLRLQ